MLLPKPKKQEKKKPKGLKSKGFSKKKGKKTLQWEETRARIFSEFAAKGIVECELNLEGCWRNSWLSLAHSEKRRNLTEETYEEVILACVPCHEKIEYKKEMSEIVRQVIKDRFTR